MDPYRPRQEEEEEADDGTSTERRARYGELQEELSKSMSSTGSSKVVEVNSIPDMDALDEHQNNDDGDGAPLPALADSIETVETGPSTAGNPAADRMRLQPSLIRNVSTRSEEENRAEDDRASQVPESSSSAVSRQSNKFGMFTYSTDSGEDRSAFVGSHGSVLGGTSAVGNDLRKIRNSAAGTGHIEGDQRHARESDSQLQIVPHGQQQETDIHQAEHRNNNDVVVVSNDASIIPVSTSEDNQSEQELHGLLSGAIPSIDSMPVETPEDSPSNATGGPVLLFVDSSSSGADSSHLLVPLAQSDQNDSLNQHQQNRSNPTTCARDSASRVPHQSTTTTVTSATRASPAPSPSNYRPIQYSQRTYVPFASIAALSSDSTAASQVATKTVPTPSSSVQTPSNQNASSAPSPHRPQSMPAVNGTSTSTFGNASCISGGACARSDSTPNSVRNPPSPLTVNTRNDSDSNEDHPVIATTRSGGEVVVSKRVGAAPPRPVTPSRSRHDGTPPTTPGRSRSFTMAPSPPNSRRSPSPQPTARSTSPGYDRGVVHRRPSAREYNGVSAIRLSLDGSSPSHTQQPDRTSADDAPKSATQDGSFTSPSTGFLAMTLRDDPESMSMMTTQPPGGYCQRGNRSETGAANQYEGSTERSIVESQQEQRDQHAAHRPQQRKTIRITKEGPSLNTATIDSQESQPAAMIAQPSLDRVVATNDSKPRSTRIRVIRDPDQRSSGKFTSEKNTTTATTGVSDGGGKRPARFGMSPEDWEAKQRAKYGPQWKSRRANDSDSNQCRSNASVAAASEHTASTVLAGTALREARPGVVAVSQGRQQIHISGSARANRNSMTDEEMTEAKRRARGPSRKTTPITENDDSEPRLANKGTADAVSNSMNTSFTSECSQDRARISGSQVLPNGQPGDRMNAGMHSQPDDDDDADLLNMSDDEAGIDDGGIDAPVFRAQTTKQGEEEREEKMQAALPRMGPTRTFASMRMAETLQNNAEQRRGSALGQQPSPRTAARPTVGARNTATDKAEMKISRLSTASQTSGGARLVSPRTQRGSLSRRLRRERQKYANLQGREEGDGNNDNNYEDDGVEVARSIRASATPSVVSDITMSDMDTGLGDGGRPSSRLQQYSTLPNPPIMDDASDYPEDNRAAYPDSTFDLFDTDRNQPTHIGAGVSDLPASLSDAQSYLVNNGTVEQAIAAELVVDDDIDQEEARERVRKEEERKAEERLRNNAVLAEATVIDDGPEQQSGRKRLFICFAILAVVVGIVAIVIVTTTGGNSDGDNVPIIVTAPPTSQPFNDVCELAHDLVATSDVVRTNNQDAEPDDIECEVEDQGGAGVWYTLVGIGKRLRASTCTETDIDTQIQVFSGNCDALACIGGNDQLCGDQSSIGWFAESGMTYKVLVSGFRSSNRGPITLSLDEMDDNNQCDAAVELTDGRVIYGSTRDAPSVVGLAACADATSVESPSSWYRLPGDGKPRCASLVNQRDFLFESQMSVVSGSCDDLVCVDGVGLGSSEEVLWTTDVGTDYYVVVHGSERSAEGDYQLTVKMPPEHTVCTGSVELIPGENITTSGSTAQACAVDVSQCAPSAQTSGLWYHVNGTGAILSVSTCGTQSSSVFISLLQTEDCVVQTCMSDALTRPCGDQTSLYWKSELGEVYTIFVQSTSRSSPADFTLSTKQFASRYRCEEAVTFSIEDAILFGHLNDVDTVYNQTSEGTLITRGAWYSVVGTGDSYLISTCNDASEGIIGDTDIVVFDTGCNSLRRVPAVQQTCESGKIVSLDTVEGVVYRVLVQDATGITSTNGNLMFQLSIERGRLGVPNDVCKAATVLNYPADGAPTTVLDSTTNATTDSSIEACGLSSTIFKPVWYTVRGRGDSLTASLCSDVTTFDTQLYIYRGGDCEALVCIAADDDSCGDRSIVSWVATLDETYYIVVGGHAEAEGQFRLDLGLSSV